MFYNISSLYMFMSTGTSISAEQRRAMFNVMRPHDKVSNLSTDRLKEGNNGTRKSVGRSLRCNEDTTDVINYNVNATNASKRSSPNHRFNIICRNL